MMENNHLAVSTVLVAAALVLGCSGGNNGHSHEENNHHHDDGGHSHEDGGHHEHGDGGHHEHGDGGHHHDDGGGHPDFGTPDLGPDAAVSPEAFDYCDCMLINCHDPFHERWGADDVEARNACAAEASGWPVAGSPQTSGDSLECRQHHCTEVAAGTSTCDDAFGAACE